MLRSDRINGRVAHRLRSVGGPLSGRVPGAGEQLSGRRRRPVRRQHQSRHDQRPGRLRPARPGRRAQPADRQCDDPRPARRLGDGHRQCRDGAVRPGPGPATSASPRRGSASPRAAAPTAERGARSPPRGVSRAYGPVRSTSPAPRTAPRIALDRRQSRLRHRPAQRQRHGPRDARRLGDRRRPANPLTGPFSADVVILSNRGPMTIAVNRLTFAGIDFAGRIVRTRAGPFAGTLTLAGQGLSRHRPARRRRPLSADRHRRHRQWRADAGRHADHHPARHRPAPAIILYARCAADRRRRPARRPRQRRSVRRARAGPRRSIAAATAPRSSSPRGGAACPSGSPPTPRSRPRLIRAAMQGQVNNIGFRFAQPAEIAARPAVWRLAPGDGRARAGPDPARRALGRRAGRPVAARQPRSVDAQRLLARPGPRRPGDRQPRFRPARATAASRAPRRGSTSPASPAPASRCAPRRSTSPSPATCGPRAGRLGGDPAAAARHRPLQARLQPLGPGAGSWTTRLLAAPLAGGMRYNGPADVPMSFANLPGHQLSGPIGIAADFTGRVQNPQFTGVVRANNLTYHERDLRHADHQPRRRRPLLAARRSRSSRSRAAPATARSRAAARSASPRRRASRSISGSQFQNARLARSDDIGAVATGTLAIVNDRSGALITRRARSRRGPLPDRPPGLGRSAAAGRRPPPGRAAADAGRPRQADAGVPSIWRLDIRLDADNRVFVSGMGLESEWHARAARRRGPPRRPQIVGKVELIRGTLGLAGRRFRLDRGQVAFTGDARPTRRSISSRPATSTGSRSGSTSPAARTTRRSPSPPRPACRRTRSSRASCSAAR